MCLVDGANIGNISRHAAFCPETNTFLHLISICHSDFVILWRNLNAKKTGMINIETWTLVIVWAICVVAFFVLWAILAKVVQKISEKKRKRESNDGENAPQDPVSGEIS